MENDYLRGKRIYLSGPIQYNADKTWRDYPSKVLKEKFGVELFDPFSDPKQQYVPLIEHARTQKDVETIVRIAKSFVRKDLCMVDRSDAVAAYLPHNVLTTGTGHEIINSNNAKKPTLL